MIHDTIIAKASAPGSAIRGILRISGSVAVSVIKKIICSPDILTRNQYPFLADTQIVLPQFPPFPAKLFCWKECRSYTGDETVEIHTVGSPIILDAVMTAILSASENVRLARAGEFTLRAFLFGRLDLAQAEAVLGVIDAVDDHHLKSALNQLAGNVSAPLTAVRKLLFETLIHLEASLDFADEEISFLSPQELQNTLTNAFCQIDQLRQKLTCRGLFDVKPKVVLAGLPNAGKSTLFNKLLQKETALVSPAAGTTRDYLESEILLDEIPCILIDTAGVGGGVADALDLTAQEKTKELYDLADVIIYCYENEYEKISNSEKTIVFQTKTADESLEHLKKQIGMFLRQRAAKEMLPNTALRCRENLISAANSLRRSMQLNDDSLTALELRNAVNQLGLIDGTVHTEDILDNIFSRFCIGK